MRNFYYRFAVLSIGVLTLAACADPYTPTPRPDYRIHVVSTPKGDVAIAPTCASWASDVVDPYDDQSLPQLGCSQARNLALSIERPADLVEPRPLGPERGVNAAGTIRRYDNNQARGLVDPDSAPDASVAITTAPTAASTMSGNAAGGSSSGSSMPGSGP